MTHSPSIGLAACLLFSACSRLPAAQCAPVVNPSAPHASATLVVLGIGGSLAASAVSLGVGRSAGQRHQLLESPQDLLRQDSSVFLDRGAGGEQAASCCTEAHRDNAAQRLPINDSQTAHHNLGLPISLNAIECY